jgi:two-component system chemotaxis response regulator CheV
MNNFQQDIDERSSLTQTNKFELLLFTLGGGDAGQGAELYGINVFKVREIIATPQITPIAEAHPFMMGVVKVREQIIPVIDLPAMIGCNAQRPLPLIIITEFARTTQAFAVESVAEIVRLNWSCVLPAEGAAGSSLITSIAKVDGDVPETRLAQVLDVESIIRSLQKNGAEEPEELGLGAPLTLQPGQILLAADDSVIARALIESALKAMQVPYIMVNSGKQAWDKLQELEAEARKAGQVARDKVALVLSDLEMPEMDGFTLTRNIKRDARFAGIPVVIHSSLSGAANETHVNSVGADAYIAKFVPDELAALLRKMVQSRP